MTAPREAWRTDVPWFFLAMHAPLVSNGAVVARCGHAVLSLDPSSGAIRWQTTLDERAGDGAFFLTDGGGFLSDIKRRTDGLSSVARVDDGGAITWRTDLDSLVAPDNASIVGGELLVLGAHRRGRVLSSLSTADGAVRAERDVELGGNALVEVNGGYLVRNQAPGRGSGLYWMDRDAGNVRTLEADGTWRLLRVEDAIVTVVRRSPKEPRALRVRDAQSLEVQWAVESANEAASADSERVYHLAVGSPHGTPVARDIRTGAEVWRGEPLNEPVARIEAAGPILWMKSLAGVRIWEARTGRTIDALGGGYGPPAVVGDVLVLTGAKSVLALQLDA